MVLVVVTWPAFGALSRSIGPRRSAAVLTTAVVAVIAAPVVIAVVLASRQIVEAGESWIAFTESGGLAAWRASIGATLPESVAAWLDPFAPGELITGTLQAVVQRAGGWLTTTLQAVGQGSLQAVVFVVCLASLYLEGPTVLATLKRATPMPLAVMDRLFEVFGQLAYNVMVGMLATAIGQGAVAALGFALAGVERVALLGLATTVMSQVPVVGSAVVWVPLVVALLAQQRYVAAGFVAVWSLALTASVDNVIKPMIYGHTLAVHPSLVVVAFLGGLLTLGPAGLLVGPSVLILFVTLFTLYDPGTSATR